MPQQADVLTKNAGYEDILFNLRITNGILQYLQSKNVLQVTLK